MTHLTRRLTGRRCYQLMAWLSPSYPVGAFSLFAAASNGRWRPATSRDARRRLRALARRSCVARRRRLLRRACCFAHAHRAARCTATTRRCATVARACRRLRALDGAPLETTAQGARLPRHHARRLAVRGARPLGRRVGRPGRLSGRGRGGARRPRHRRCRRALGAYLHARRRQPDLGRRAARPARPDRRPARARARSRPSSRRPPSARSRRTLDDLGSARFRADLASMRHETQYTRLFRLMRSPCKHPNGPLARRHRRPGRLRQDRADGRAVQAPARPLRHRRHHQRHLHQGGRRIPDALRRAAARAHRRRRDRRLPAHRDPRGRLDQPRRGRRHARRSFPASTSS